MIGRRALAAALAAALVAAVAGCGSGSPAPATLELRVAAAASLRTAVRVLTGTYATEQPGVRFTVTTDSSATLRAQIEQGAPVDVFLSADTRIPQALADGGFISGAPVPFAANTLALVVPVGNPAGIGTVADLARPGVRIVAAAEAVPIAAYTSRVIEALAAGTADPAAFRAALQANVVSREEDVAAVLARIVLGDGDAAFVYATDVAAGAKVVVIPIPPDANVRAEYAGVVVRTSPNVTAAAAFLDWVAGDGGRAVLAPLGFLPP